MTRIRREGRNPNLCTYPRRYTPILYCSGDWFFCSRPSSHPSSIPCFAYYFPRPLSHGRHPTSCILPLLNALMQLSDIRRPCSLRPASGRLPGAKSWPPIAESSSHWYALSNIQNFHQFVQQNNSVLPALGTLCPFLKTQARPQLLSRRNTNDGGFTRLRCRKRDVGEVGGLFSLPMY